MDDNLRKNLVFIVPILLLALFGLVLLIVPKLHFLAGAFFTIHGFLWIAFAYKRFRPQDKRSSYMVMMNPGIFTLSLGAALLAKKINYLSIFFIVIMIASLITGLLLSLLSLKKRVRGL